MPLQASWPHSLVATLSCIQARRGRTRGEEPLWTAPPHPPVVVTVESAHPVRRGFSLLDFRCADDRTRRLADVLWIAILPP